MTIPSHPTKTKILETQELDEIPEIPEILGAQDPRETPETQEIHEIHETPGAAETREIVARRPREDWRVACLPWISMGGQWI